MRVSEGSFYEKQSAMPRTAGVSGNVPEEKDIKWNLFLNREKRTERKSRVKYSANIIIITYVWWWGVEHNCSIFQVLLFYEVCSF